MTEPIVFLPGMMSDARLFAPQIRAFSATRPVMVAPITRGQRIEEIASALLPVLPRKCALAGMGMGGVVAMEILRRAPDRVMRIALMATTCLAETPQAAADREPQIVKAKAGKLTEVMRELVPPGCLAPGPQRPQVLQTVAEMAQELDPEIFIAQSRALQRRRDLQATLRRIHQPALVLCGAYDTLFPVKRHQSMADLIPHARLAVIEQAGHLPTLEAPEATNHALRHWLETPYLLR